jgi:NAD(P)H-dependent FMN reductase
VPHIVGIAGSLRQGSLNAALLRACAEAAPAGCEVEIASIREVPLYDGDLEARQGTPPAVKALQDRIAAADGLLLVSPEYNNSIPGALKNAVDWLTRPPAEAAGVFADRAVAVGGATPGRGGTMLAQAAWLPVLRTLGTRVFTGPRLQVSGAGQAFDGTGRLADAEARRGVERFMAAFAAFAARR